jgi:3-deoxy-D-arabino-heptulosonate 7-phosphate (DAHP) synthase
MALAAAACGADGLIIEVHRNPQQALSDGQQSLYPAQFAALMGQLKGILPILGKTLT